MKKAFKFYCVIWVLVFGLFNLVTFLPFSWMDNQTRIPAFWIGYSLVVLALMGHFVCGVVSYKDESKNRAFYSIPLNRICYIALFLTLIFGGISVLFSHVIQWIGMILCAIIFVVNVVAVVKATAVVNVLGGIDDKIAKKTCFIRAFTSDAEGLIDHAKSEAVKLECKKVYEAFRYSDPVSDDKLKEIEGRIETAFAALSAGVEKDDSKFVEEVSREIILLINDRNRLCKLLK